MIIVNRIPTHEIATDYIDDDLLYDVNFGKSYTDIVKDIINDTSVFDQVYIAQILNVGFLNYFPDDWAIKHFVLFDRMSKTGKPLFKKFFNAARKKKLETLGPGEVVADFVGEHKVNKEEE